jgi:hypothetical protein
MAGRAGKMSWKFAPRPILHIGFGHKRLDLYTHISKTAQLNTQALSCCEVRTCNYRRSQAHNYYHFLKSGRRQCLSLSLQNAADYVKNAAFASMERDAPHKSNYRQHASLAGANQAPL